MPLSLRPQLCIQSLDLVYLGFAGLAEGVIAALVFISHLLDDAFILLDQAVFLGLVALPGPALHKLALPSSALTMLQALGSGLLHLSSSDLHLYL